MDEGDSADDLIKSRIHNQNKSQQLSAMKDDKAAVKKDEPVKKPDTPKADAKKEKAAEDDKNAKVANKDDGKKID